MAGEGVQRVGRRGVFPWRGWVLAGAGGPQAP